MGAIKIKDKEPDDRGHYYRHRMRKHGQRYREFHWPSSMLLFDLAYTYDITAARMSRELGSVGLSLSAFNMLMILHRSEGRGCPLHELSELMIVSRANITGLVDCLEQKGLVERVMDENDRRVRVARITKAGEKLLESFLPSHFTSVRDMCSGLTNLEKSTLSRLLAKFRRSVMASTAPQKGKKK
jgi:MarR family 2-MHQ and catechol resistance regulon transcriptional repressor